MTIPTMEAKLSKSQQKKAKRDAVYKLYTDITKTVKDGLKTVPDNDLESLIAGFMSLMKEPDDDDTKEITLPVESLQQMAVFATQCVSRQLLERQ